MNKAIVRNKDILLYAATIGYIIYSFLVDNTMFGLEWHGQFGIPLKVFYICEVIILFFAIYSIIDEKDKTRRILYIAITAIGLVNMNMLLIMWIAFAGRSMKRWLELALGVSLTTLGFTMFCAAMGWVGIMGHNLDSFAFGMVNRTNFAFAVLFAIISVGILKKGRFRYYEYVVLYIIILATYYLVGAKNSMVCMLLFVTLCLLSQVCGRFLRGEKVEKVLGFLQKYLFDYSFIIAYALFKIVVYMKENIRMLEKDFPAINTFMIRLDTAEEVAAMPFTFFGQRLHEYGGNDGNYFVVDSFLARSPVFDGLVIFVVCMLVLTYFLIRARREKAVAVYFAFITMALYCITDPCFTDPSLNFVIVLPFACWDIYGDTSPCRDTEWGKANEN